MIDHIRVVFSRSVFSLLLNFLSGLILARLLIPSDRGDLAILIALSIIISAISNLSSNEIIVKSKGNPTLLDLLSGIVISILIGLFVLFFLHITSYKELIQGYYWYFLIFIPLNFTTLISIALLQRDRKFSGLMLVRNIYPLLNSILIISFATIENLTILGVLISYLISNFIVAIYSVYIVRDMVKLEWKLYCTRRVISNIHIFHPITCLTILSSQLDKLVGSSILSSAEFGNYVVAITIPLAVTTVIISTAQTILLPIINKDNIKDIVCWQLYFFIWVGLPCFLVLLYLTDWLVPHIFGDKYSQASFMVYVGGLSLFFQVFRKVNVKSIKQLGMEGKFILVEITIILMNVFLLSYSSSLNSRLLFFCFLDNYEFIYWFFIHSANYRS
ncbi:oligosaccharide flippase family protein [Grimontia sp. S25]|uniref:Oligosaccharide flippase family protein n=1 Tax=Grimontia sedimenti TaxID=2711294 RepID=A0A6M1RRH4_9GAMM|nr:oligosaccharide flippase family protein [Grimontia sedimenti]NGO00120.1 oligosaccharide flippase family protein [Grimontia sedimenti]